MVTPVCVRLSSCCFCLYVCLYVCERVCTWLLISDHYILTVLVLTVPDTDNGVTLHTRDVVRVVGVSRQHGKLKVLHGGCTYHLPSHMLLLQVCTGDQ